MPEGEILPDAGTKTTQDHIQLENERLDYQQCAVSALMREETMDYETILYEKDLPNLRGGER